MALSAETDLNAILAMLEAEKPQVAIVDSIQTMWSDKVEAAPGSGLDEAGAMAFARSTLKGYMVPRKVVMVEALPRDPSGKIFKRKLRDVYGRAI